ncbi:hypothetical protein H310_02738 [Aphanomyces invadans]|uniref:Uncharacterized protein n=1 Tax=Aphanomyces invadans TaxID=157072 RepID=A0A024UK01_9STRA|nr:hypothetical protein H310_02738 [Aphanomyces invadans]ETW06495.1 hypothetical protein H310_02738 [Aphanomyces invadans]|eukprot:XP_008864570.1 hypothetical protein H310_02738 [Aphanomyces invadans]
MELPRRGRFLAKDPPHANSDNIRGIFGTLPLATMLEELPVHGRQHVRAEVGITTPALATQAIDRLENAMRLLEDVYGYVTNAEMQGHARTSMLAELGSLIIEAKKAADCTIALFHDTLAHLPTPPSPPRALPHKDVPEAVPSTLTSSPSISCHLVDDEDDFEPNTTSQSPPRRKVAAASDLPDVKPPITKNLPSPKQRQLKAPSPPKAAMSHARLDSKNARLWKDLHAEFHAKKAELKQLRRRIGDAERLTKTQIHDHTQALRGLERLQLDLPR